MVVALAELLLDFGSVVDDETDAVALAEPVLEKTTIALTCFDDPFESVPNEQVNVDVPEHPATVDMSLVPDGRVIVSLALDALAGPAFFTVTR